jgi:hypothetical protein
MIVVQPSESLILGAGFATLVEAKNDPTIVPIIGLICAAGAHPFELRSKGGTSSIENLANARDQKLSTEPIQSFFLCNLRLLPGPKR